MSKTYDNLQRLRSLHYGEAHRDWGMSFVYNLGNQLTTSSRFDGRFWTYDYDALGQVAQARKHLGSTVIPGYEFDYAYDDIGNRTSAMRDTSATREQLYHSAVSAGGTAGANALNQYGSRTTPRILGVMGKAHESAAITVNSQTATRTGEYWQALLDYAGEPSPNAPRWAILALDASLYMGGGNTARADLTEKAELPPNPENFTYDADGNLATDWRWTYTWNAENRLVALEPSSVAVALGLPEEKITYAYDSQGRRFQRKVFAYDPATQTWATNPSDVTLYLYDDWNLIYEADLSVPSNPQSALTNPRSYTWGLDLSGTMQGAGGVGGLLAVANDSGNTYYPVYDHIGNVRAYVDGVTADVVAEFEYSPFGETLQASGSKVNEFAFRFSTKHQDASSGLYYYGYRWYDSELGRWLNRDPIGEEGGLNLYAFVSNDGVNQWDYLGLIIYFSIVLNNEATTDLIQHFPHENSHLEKPDRNRGNVFTGDKDNLNDPDSTDKKGAGAIPKGIYYIVDRESGGRLGFIRDFISGKEKWFALYREDDRIDDQTTINGVVRGQFRLHPGRRSAGCVTFKDEKLFDEIREELLSTQKGTVPGTQIPYYGIIEVK